MGTVNLLDSDTLLIAFGHKSHHGKDTAAAAIMNRYGTEYGIARYAFADSLKEEFYDVLLQPNHPYWGYTKDNYLALPHPRIQFCSNTDKRSWVNQNKAELGSHIQVYGTDFVRSRDPFYWIRKLREKLSLDRPKVALLTDMRFHNEALFAKACQGYTVKVTRQNFVNPHRDPAHVSEIALDGFVFDYEIQVPDGERAQLEEDACELFQIILDRQQPVVPEFGDDEAVSLVAQ